MIEWIKAYWNKHGTKVMGTVTAVLGSLQTAIMTGLIEVGKGVKNAIGVALIVLGSAIVKRSVGSPPKDP